MVRIGDLKHSPQRMIRVSVEVPYPRRQSQRAFGSRHATSLTALTNDRDRSGSLGHSSSTSMRDASPSSPSAITDADDAPLARGPAEGSSPRGGQRQRHTDQARSAAQSGPLTGLPSRAPAPLALSLPTPPSFRLCSRLSGEGVNPSLRRLPPRGLPPSPSPPLHSLPSLRSRPRRLPPLPAPTSLSAHSSLETPRIPAANEERRPMAPQKDRALPFHPRPYQGSIPIDT